MVKKLLRFSLAAIIVLLTIALPVYAADVGGASHVADIVVTNTGTAEANVVTVCPINTQALIDGKYATSDLLNTALQTQGGTDVPYMPGVSTNPWVFWVSSIEANESKPYLFYAGGGAMQEGFYYFPNTGGMTSSDSPSLEPGDNFIIEQRGYIDTSAGADKDLDQKEGACKTYVNGAGNITSAITALPEVAAVTGGYNNTLSTSHTVNLPSGIASGNLLLVFFAAEGVPNITFPGGWTQLDQNSNTSVRFGVWYRIADGTEGSSISVTTSQSKRSAHTSYRIINYSGTPEACDSTGASDSPDPPNLTPSWGGEGTLWFAACANALSWIVSSYPTDYTDGRNDKGNEVSVGSARRLLSAASENPGVFTLSGSTNWVAFTVAVQPAELSVTATGIPSCFGKVVRSANGVNLTISVYDENDVLIDDDTVALGGVSVLDNDNDWSFITNGSMVYMEYQKIWVNGTLVQHIVYERDTTFDDLTSYNNDATPTFATTSSDPDISATFQNFRPINEAKCTAGATEEEPELITTTPETPKEFFGGAESGIENLPGAATINVLLDKVGIPQDLFWIIIIYYIALGAFLLTHSLMKSSLLWPAVVGGVMIAFFSLVCWGNPIPLWTVFVYGIRVTGWLVAERTFGW